MCFFCSRQSLAHTHTHSATCDCAVFRRFFFRRPSFFRARHRVDDAPDDGQRRLRPTCRLARFARLWRSGLVQGITLSLSLSLFLVLHQSHPTRLWALDGARRPVIRRTCLVFFVLVVPFSHDIAPSTIANQTNKKTSQCVPNDRSQKNKQKQNAVQFAARLPFRSFKKKSSFNFGSRFSAPLDGFRDGHFFSFHRFQRSNFLGRALCLLLFSFHFFRRPFQ